MIEHERKVGPKGQVVIPRHFRSSLGIKPSTRVYMTLHGDSVIIRSRPADAKKAIEEFL